MKKEKKRIYIMKKEKNLWRKKRIYILEIFIAISNRCGVEHMLFFILSNVCHRLSNACYTFAIVSAFDDASFLHRDEWDIRHTDEDW